MNKYRTNGQDGLAKGGLFKGEGSAAPALASEVSLFIRPTRKSSVKGSTTSLKQHEGVLDSEPEAIQTFQNESKTLVGETTGPRKAGF